MSRTDEILKQLKEIANDPKKAMDDYKKETGKGAIGIMPLYAPEELVYAAGYLPMGIWGGSKTISKARAYLPAFSVECYHSGNIKAHIAYTDINQLADTRRCII